MVMSDNDGEQEGSWGISHTQSLGAGAPPLVGITLVHSYIAAKGVDLCCSSAKGKNK